MVGFFLIPKGTMEKGILFEGNSGLEESRHPNQNSLRKEYEELLPLRTLLVRDLELYVEEAVTSLSSRPRIKGRIKSFESYFKKYIRQLKDEASPLITDLAGIRIICPFLEDLATVEKLLSSKLKVIEVERKGGDHTFREFGYESIHLLVAIPEDILKNLNIPSNETVEIQIRTILQDAWAEVEHELVYKAEFSPFDSPLKRKLAAVNASLSLADIIFQEIRSYEQELNGQLEKRRDSFFRKIEETTDAVLFMDGDNTAQESGADDELVPPPAAAGSIDELLLNALYAHNRNHFSAAIAIYTQILEMEPEDAISSLIYKHRGMAYFARSHYEEAIADFSESLKLDSRSYKAAYYEGVVCSVLCRYSDAVDAFNRSLEINPFQPYCLYRRGQAYYHLEDYPKALGDCEAALALESFEAVRKLRNLLQIKLRM